MLKLVITRQEFAQLRRFMTKFRWDRNVTFSVNCHRRTWAFANWGLTPENRRKAIGGCSEKLDVITEEYLRVRQKGGRFFLKNDGAFYKDKSGQMIPFVQFLS